MKDETPKEISDALIGEDEKVCSCSMRIAGLIRSGNPEPSLARALAAVRKQEIGQQGGEADTNS